MNTIKGWAVVITTIVGLSAVLTLSQSEPGQQVAVTNFPKTYDVQGSVSIKGTASHAQFTKHEGIVVPTSRRLELTELTSVGTLNADGFTYVTISLQGEVKSAATANGIVGVMLVPDEEPVLRAFREAKRVEFSIEAPCQLYKGGSPFFDTGSVTEQLGFGRYKIFLYNTASHSVEANVYINLKN
jgi:hypothetical protein